MIPTAQQWHAATWHARQRWADEHGLTVREARRFVLEHTFGSAPVPRPPTPVRTIPAWLRASLDGDRDPLVVAQRRADITGLPLTHPDVTRKLPRLARAW